MCTQARLKAEVERACEKRQVCQGYNPAALGHSSPCPRFLAQRRVTAHISTSYLEDACPLTLYSSTTNRRCTDKAMKAQAHASRVRDCVPSSGWLGTMCSRGC
eukprot:230598-Amphidinium_carterae.1